MCGVAGVADFAGRPVSREAILAMMRSLAHRGPDGEGFWLDPAGCVSLGHRRLAVRDLSEAGRQPMSDPSGRITISYNGEIYNDRELRAILEREHGARFRSRCDAEVIPLGFLAFGEAIFDRLEGMFAIALWDAREQTLWLARDAAGVKPLFVARDGARVRFASEVKGLLADPEQGFRLSPEALHAYLAQGYVAPDATMLDGVAQLPPGTVRRIDAGGARDRCFWRPQRRPDIRSLDDALDAFGEAWRCVVGDLLVSDVPLGVLQSGGVDSSLVSYALRDRPELPVFTARFEERSHDESVLAGEVASGAGARLHHVSVAGGDVVGDFRAVVHHFDGQLADSSGLALFALARAVRRHTVVALSGDGADEFFGGYPTYRMTRLATAVAGKFPPAALQTMSRALGRLGRRNEARLPPLELVSRLLLGVCDPGIACHAAWRRLVMPHRLGELYGSALRPLAGAVDPLAGYVRALREAEGGVVDRALLADQRFYLPADMLQKVDAMSMAHALEIRVPFLDRRVMDLAGRMDASLLVPLLGPTKKILRAALRRAGAPERVVSGPKRGLNVPLLRLLRGPLRMEGDRLLDRDAERLEPFLRADGVRRMWHEVRDSHAAEPYGTWALLSLASWLEQRAACAPVAGCEPHG